MTILDRLLFRAYLRAYAICFVSLLSLYVIIDLFTNLDDFAEKDLGLVGLLSRIGLFYAYQSVLIFDRLCEAIVLLAAVFTVTWAQRSNELMPMLASGIPIHRVLRPVYLASCLMLAIGSANQELLIPRVTEQLMAPRDDPDGKKQVGVRGAYDATGVHVEGMVATRATLSVKHLYVTIPETLANGMVHLSAGEATYVPTVAGVENSGGWMLNATEPPSLPEWGNEALLKPLDPGKYFLRTADVDFDAITRNKNWYTMASTLRLYELLGRSDAQRMPALAVQFHSRLVRPFVGFMLVVFGLGLILRDQGRNVFISAGMCLAMQASFYVVLVVTRHLGESDLIAPTLAAWLPALVFGPPAYLMYDEMQT